MTADLPATSPSYDSEPDPQGSNSTALRNTLLGVIGILIGVMLIAVGFLGRAITEDDEVAAVAAPTVTADSSPDPVLQSGPDFLVLDEILQILENDFVEPDLVDPEYLHGAAIRGIFDALDDPHSTYIDPQTYAMSREGFSGVFQGIGATVEKPAGSDYIVIVRPLPDTPAARAGLLSGDQILAVDGEDAAGWTLDEGVLRIRGPQGTPVELLIRHPDGVEELITIVRDEIHSVSVSTQPLLQQTLTDSAGNEVTDIGYVYIAQITRRTPDELTQIVNELEDRGVTGLIIDVRLNPGGLLAETTEIADMFLDQGPIVIQVDRDGNEQVWSSSPGQITYLPIVIIQDEFSASGSELLAAALQENGRATVIGVDSFGKGTVNNVRELSNGGAVYVSIARWLTPDRNQIEGRGVKPDIVVEFTMDDIDQGRDVQAERAIDFLRDIAN